MIKYIRGSIWWANLASKELTGNSKTHIQVGSRPVIVVSKNKANAFSPILTVIPLTTQKDDLPCRPEVFVNRDTPSYCLIEQIRPIDKSSLDNYSGMCTDEELASIDSAIFDFLFSDSECEFDKVDYSKFDVDPKVYEKKSDDIKKTNSPSIISSGKYSGMTNTEKFMEKFKKADPTTRTHLSVSDARKKEWTTDRKIAFLNDAKTMSAQELADKYHITSLSTVYTYKNKWGKEYGLK